MEIKSLETSQGQKRHASFSMLSLNNRVSIMQQLGPQFGVDILVLQKEGENYSHNELVGGQNIGKRWGNLTVPKNNCYVRISSPKTDLSDFWDAVKAEEKAQQPSANTPKI